MLKHNSEHDYVVVGAGSAGCLLADRLSAGPSHSVLLLESGPPDRHRAITTPIAFASLFKSSFDWAYTTTGQAGLLGREVYWPRGKTGSSVLRCKTRRMRGFSLGW
jgi:choline dehydrogenase